MKKRRSNRYMDMPVFTEFKGTVMQILNYKFTIYYSLRVAKVS